MLQTFNVPAGGRQINAKASFLRLESVNAGGADESVRVRADGQDLGTYQPGDALRLPIDAVSWEVNPVTITATCVVRLGVGGVESSRVAGTVQVIDGGKARTLANQAFIGYASVTGNAGCVPVVELFNPAAANTRVVVRAIRVSTGTAGVISLAHHNAVLAQGPFDPQNKRLGGASSVAKLYRDPGLAAAPGTSFESLNVGAGLVVPITLQEPITIEPGRALVVSHQTLVSTVLAAFEFVEEPNT